MINNNKTFTGVRFTERKAYQQNHHHYHQPSAKSQLTDSYQVRNKSTSRIDQSLPLHFFYERVITSAVGVRSTNWGIILFPNHPQLKTSPCPRIEKKKTPLLDIIQGQQENIRRNPINLCAQTVFISWWGQITIAFNSGIAYLVYMTASPYKTLDKGLKKFNKSRLA